MHRFSSESTNTYIAPVVERGDCLGPPFPENYVILLSYCFDGFNYIVVSCKSLPYHERLKNRHLKVSV